MRKNDRAAAIAAMPRDEQIRALVEDLIDSSIMPLVRAVIVRRSKQIIDCVREELDKDAARYIAQLATERDGLREQHGRDSAELCRLCAERDKLRQQLAALREQIEKSPVAEPDGGWIDVAVPDSWNGNRVRLVLED